MEYLVYGLAIVGGFFLLLIVLGLVRTQSSVQKEQEVKSYDLESIAKFAEPEVLKFKITVRTVTGETKSYERLLPDRDLDFYLDSIIGSYILIEDLDGLTVKKEVVAASIKKVV